ncbi:hypothetical protein T492DRAFT_861204 [Pavlovales sp. CCMP2436]|nr:hypothetical protein T492DRAFT_861204 [Pavlovales sp. CCMP2436]
MCTGDATTPSAPTLQSTAYKDGKNFVVTSEATIKLTELEMKTRLEELTESGEMCLMMRTLDGYMYRLHTLYNEWSDQFWKPQIDPSGIEGLLVIDQASVDYSQVSAHTIVEHLLLLDDQLDVSQKLGPIPPRVMTFMEARFWLAYGVCFDGLVALVSYDLHR